MHIHTSMPLSIQIIPGEGTSREIHFQRMTYRPAYEAIIECRNVGRSRVRLRRCCVMHYRQLKCASVSDRSS